MPAVFRNVGFDADGGKVRIGSGTTVYSGSEARQWLARRAAGQLKEGDVFYQSWLDAGITEDVIHETLQAVGKWAEMEDAWYAALQCLSMRAAHRPDFAAFRKESAERRKNGTQYKDHYMWPQVDQEDLLKPRTLLLLLLDARGRHYPSQFAGAARGNASRTRPSRCSARAFEAIRHGYPSGKDKYVYGKLISWDEHPDTFHVDCCNKECSSFLVESYKYILQDFDTDGLVTDDFLLQTEPTLSTETEIRGFDSLAVMAAEVSYRLPAHMDLDRIEALLRAKSSAAEDHAWALREDQGYFADQLAEAMEHRQEMLVDTNNNVHPRRFIFREPLTSGKMDLIQIRSRAAPKMNKIETQLLWLLCTLWGDGRELFLVSMPLALDELERLQQTEPQAKDLATSHIAQIIGDPSILSQCIVQLDLYQPVIGVLGSKALSIAATRLGDPPDRRFAYPSEKRPTEENTTILCQAEDHSDALWTVIDRAVEISARGEEKSNSTPATPKIKQKTRGVTLKKVSEDAATTVATDTSPHTVTTLIKVDARALKVFCLLFCNPNITSYPEEISLNDLLCAMTSTGSFSAEKLYGSLWEFQMMDGEDQSRIQFHEPHPHSKIPFVED
ncbi:hypothetical protein G7046_g6177 [Stylonectria norvegica]|nr:hypothetical protein G7046_g6177 [Stylonectria norvegica]